MKTRLRAMLGLMSSGRSRSKRVSCFFRSIRTKSLARARACSSRTILEPDAAAATSSIATARCSRTPSRAIQSIADPFARSRTPARKPLRSARRSRRLHGQGSADSSPSFDAARRRWSFGTARRVAGRHPVRPLIDARGRLKPPGICARARETRRYYPKLTLGVAPARVRRQRERRREGIESKYHSVIAGEKGRVLVQVDAGAGRDIVTRVERRAHGRRDPRAHHRPAPAAHRRRELARGGQAWTREGRLRP